MKKIKILNLTPHGVNLIKDGKVIKTFPSQGVIRLSENRARDGSVQIDGVKIPIYRKSFGGGELPPEKKGTLIIVSLPVAQAFPERQDLIIPDQLVRDKEGRIIGCESFAKLGGAKSPSSSISGGGDSND